MRVGLENLQPQRHEEQTQQRLTAVAADDLTINDLGIGCS
jgi:hypothetical protein